MKTTNGHVQPSSVMSSSHEQDAAVPLDLDIQGVHDRASLLAHLRQMYRWYAAATKFKTATVNSRKARIRSIKGAIPGEKVDYKQFLADRPLVAAHLGYTFHAEAEAKKAKQHWEKLMQIVVRQMPAYDWVRSVKGFGETNFAAVLAETGDLANYSGTAKVWKRMGLATDEAEGIQRRTTDKEKAIRMGFSPRRRAVAFQLSDCLQKKPNDYQPLYYLRREHTIETHPDWSDGHRHKDALRFIGKRALADLWEQWMKETGGDHLGVDALLPNVSTQDQDQEHIDTHEMPVLVPA